MHLEYDEELNYYKKEKVQPVQQNETPYKGTLRPMTLACKSLSAI